MFGSIPASIKVCKLKEQISLKCSFQAVRLLSRHLQTLPEQVALVTYKHIEAFNTHSFP